MTRSWLPPTSDEPDIWSVAGWVCRACGQPTETMPCEVHQPIARAEEASVRHDT